MNLSPVICCLFYEVFLWCSLFFFLLAMLSEDWQSPSLRYPSLVNLGTARLGSLCLSFSLLCNGEICLIGVCVPLLV